VRATLVALLVATIFRLWDGRVLEAVEWIRHGEEYVITLRDGTTLILRQQEVREVRQAPAPATAPQPARPGG